MAVRHAGSAAFTAWRTSPQPRHFGRQAGLIDEDQLCQIELAVEPFAATLHRRAGACAWD